ncbi:hypothetical protein BKA62DRAFT_153153 [Auriculariales sp. MPI-PUGE-AT-0066]|nr:hypothetical protein BKA62DRAFT_153153 [Auriculariales sp. MPI-PUGE-AT-0066]
MLEMIYVTSGLPYPLSAVPQVVLLIISYIKSVALEQAWASQLMAGMETQWTSIPKHYAVSGVIVADQLLQGDVRSFFNHVCHIAVRLRVLQAVQPVHLFIPRGTYDAIFAQEVVNLAHASEENSAPPSVVTRLPEPFVQVPSNEEDVGVAPNEEDVGIAPNDEISNAINIILERSADSGSARMVVLAADTRRMGDALVAALLRRDPRVASHFGNQRFSVQCKTLVQPTMILEFIIQMLRLPRTSNDLAVVRRHLESSPRTLLVLENLNVRRLMKARTTVNLTMLLGVLAAVQTVTLVITTLSLVLPPGIEWADGVSQPLYSLRPGETRRIFANLVAGIPSERNYNSNRHEVDHSHPHVPLQNLMTNFPTEMWACVARHCDRRSLQELSLTSKSFMHEAQRELFRELHFTGWTGSDTPTKPVAKVALARIVGLSTASSRTYIQSVVLKIWTSGHASDKAHAIGERLYDLLPQLPNLQSVLAIDVRMKNDQLARLCGGPNRALRRVTLRGCLFPFDTTVPYNIEELIIEEPASLQPTETAVVSLAYAAVGLINLSCIRILHLKTPVLVEQLIPQLVTEARFQALEELRISLCDQWPKQLTPLLHRCPKLVQLRLSATFDLARVHAGKLDTMIPRHIASIVIKHRKGVRQSRR